MCKHRTGNGRHNNKRLKLCGAWLCVDCCRSNRFTKYHVRRVEFLTWGLVPVGLERDVVGALPPFGSRHVLHLTDLWHAELGVVVEKNAPLQDGELMLGPVPELPEVLVVQGVEWVVTGKQGCVNIFATMPLAEGGNDFLWNLSSKIWSSIWIKLFVISTVRVAKMLLLVFFCENRTKKQLPQKGILKRSVHF